MEFQFDYLVGNREDGWGICIPPTFVYAIIKLFLFCTPTPPLRFVAFRKTRVTKFPAYGKATGKSLNFSATKHSHPELNWLTYCGFVRMKGFSPPIKCRS